MSDILQKAFVFILNTPFRSRLVHDGIVLSKIYEKRDTFEIIVCFQFLDGDVLRSPSEGVYISHLILIERVCNNIDFYNTSTKTRLSI